MGGDYSRKRFDKGKRYSGVLMQQGRVQLDSDWNEGVAISDRRWRAETLDVTFRPRPDDACPAPSPPQEPLASPAPRAGGGDCRRRGPGMANPGS